MTVSIALGPHGFILTVPSTLEGRSHDIEVPANESGITVIRKVLSAQARAIKEYERKLGFEASPTQAMVEQWLRLDRITRAAAKSAEVEEKETKRMADAKAAIAGIDLGELDL